MSTDERAVGQETYLCIIFLQKTLDVTVYNSVLGQCVTTVPSYTHPLLAGLPTNKMEQLVLYERQSPATAGFHTDDQSPPCLIYGCEGWVDVHLSAPKQVPPCINQPETNFLNFS